MLYHATSTSQKIKKKPLKTLEKRSKLQLNVDSLSMPYHMKRNEEFSAQTGIWPCWLKNFWQWSFINPGQRKVKFRKKVEKNGPDLKTSKKLETYGPRKNFYRTCPQRLLPLLFKKYNRNAEI